MRIVALAWVMLALAAVGTQPVQADTERDLRHRWEGAWVLLRVPTSSGCSGFFTDNEVRGELTTGKGRYGFEPGELAQIHKLELKRKRAVLKMRIREPLLVSSRGGPFTLYEEVSCKVQLDLPLPENRGGADAGTVASNVLERVLERHTTERGARESGSWNGRLRDPYPEDYEETLARYQAWQAEQFNVAVQAKLDEAVTESARIVERVRDDPDYLAGFGAGIDSGRDAYVGDCDSLVDRRPYAPSGRGKKESRTWRKGFEDGHLLAEWLATAYRLRDCLVSVPAISLPPLRLGDDQ